MPLNLPINLIQNPPWKSASAHNLANSERLSLRENFEKAERELEYNHRHTFIGTASLNDFLNSPDVAPIYTTTKRHIVKTFMYLASEEQL
jgi:hypothetical protein